MKSLATWAFFFLLVAPLQAENRQFSLTLVSKSDGENVPVCVPILLDTPPSPRCQVFLSHKERKIPGQLTIPSLDTESAKPQGQGAWRRDLHFILPTQVAGHKQSWTVSLVDPPTAKPRAFFQWHLPLDSSPELEWVEGDAARPVLRYMGMPYDPSTPKARNRTYKVFHHLYDPQGKRLVTNGGHNDPFEDEKKLLFPHHRGLMYGFNRITYGNNKKADTWHCTGDDYLEQDKTVAWEAGPVLGRHRVGLNWHGSPQEVFATEERELTVFYLPGGTLVEFASRLKTTGGLVKLDGDPQHAGFQFRAANEVAEKTAKQTYYLRPNGKGKPGETINWDIKNAPDWTVNVPWKAMSFVLGGKRYTAAYLDHPANPREARHSERDYGRFGCYFTWDLTEDRPLVVRYRLWLQEGEMTAAQAEGLSRAFGQAPVATFQEK